jgi:proteasome alpha subunit
VFTPYDWQEAIGHRAHYVESKLQLGAPVLAASFEFGILMLTYRRQARKLFEVYDRLAFGAIGQQSDVEAVRLAAVDFAHQEGYRHSEDDVTLQRVVTAISGPIKRAFADFGSPPVVAQGVFAEICAAPDDDAYAVLEYDGDYQTRKRHACAAPDGEIARVFEERLREIKPARKGEKSAIVELDTLWNEVMEKRLSLMQPEESEGLVLEVAILDREPKGEARFRYLETAPERPKKC